MAERGYLKKKLQDGIQLILICQAICACLVSFPFSAPAEEATAPPVTSGFPKTPLSLQDCIEIARDKSHARLASRFSMEIAEAQHRQALSGHFPQLTDKAVYNVMDQDPNFVFPAKSFQMPATTVVATTPLGPIPINVPASTYNIPKQNVKLMDNKNFYNTLSLTIPIYTGGQVSAIVKQAEQGMKAAKEEARRTDLQITYDVTRYYYGAVLSRELVQIARDSLARMEVTLELTEKLYTQGSGRVKKTDYLRNKTVVEWLRSTLKELEGREQLAKAALTNAMGIPWDVPVEPSAKEIPFAPAKADLKDLVSEAYLFNPDWASLDAGLIAAEAKIKEAGSGHLPKIGLFGNFTHIENSYDQGIVTSENRNAWSIGIGIEIPLFNGLRTVNEVREMRARLGRLKEQQFLLKEGIALQVKHVFIQMMSAQEQKGSTEAAALSAEENRSLNERAYQEELVETKDVIEAQLIESLMKAQYQKSLYDNIDARANLAFIVGREITEMIQAAR
jgi:outer membrane protein TolC